MIWTELAWFKSLAIKPQAGASPWAAQGIDDGRTRTGRRDLLDSRR
jgi:hypothetical protein